MRGVNLGGWLVLERWMTPSLFESVEGQGEYALGEQLGEAEARRRLKHHRDTFITAEHIVQIKELGLNAVRVPVGYWLFEDQLPYVGGGFRYLDRLFEWVEGCGLAVIIDIHGAPDSQNGHDHSGRPGTVGWGSADNSVAATLAFLKKLIGRYGHQPQLIGIEVLNEPAWSIGTDVLIDYYRQAHLIIRHGCAAHVRTIVSDAFHPKEMARALRRAKLHDTVLDIHLYQLFTPEDRALDLGAHLKKAEREWGKLLKRIGKHHELLVGEWSAAMSELYDTADGRPRHSYEPQDYAAYARQQRRTFEAQGAGWTYWTARTEDGGIWSLLDHPELVG